jgi:hypothetical protein
MDMKDEKNSREARKYVRGNHRDIDYRCEDRKKVGDLRGDNARAF